MCQVKLYYIRTRENANKSASGYALLNSFSEHIRDDFISPDGEIIDIADVDKIMTEIEEKYKLISLLSFNRKIKVLLISNTHIKFNSICNAVCSSDNPNEFYYEFYLFHCRGEDSKCHPAYIFLHELGHALQIYITHDYTKIPESFCIMSNEVIGKPLEQGSEAIEIFADAFAIAMMRVFGWERYSPFKDFDEGIKTVFTEYMVRIIEFYCKDK